MLGSFELFFAISSVSYYRLLTIFITFSTQLRPRYGYYRVRTLTKTQSILNDEKKCFSFWLQYYVVHGTRKKINRLSTSTEKNYFLLWCMDGTWYKTQSVLDPHRKYIFFCVIQLWFMRLGKNSIGT